VKTYIFVYAGSLLLAIASTPVVILAARALRIYDAPDARKIHVSSVPRIGGVAIFLAMMGLTIPVLLLGNRVGEAFRSIQPQVIALLAAGTAVFLVGFVDDLYRLRPATKLIAQVLAATVVCAFGIRIDSVVLRGGFSLEFGWYAWPLTMLWIVGLTNAVNFIDGLDGLAAGISTVACAVIAVLALTNGQVVMAVLMLALLGGLTGFLCFNFNPARVFMGDCGSLFLGFMIAASSVMCATKSAAIVGLALPFLALGVPIFDTLFSMLRRILDRRSVFASDRSHIHHRLLDMGLHQRSVVIFIYLVTLLAAGLGMFMIITREPEALAVFCCVSLLLVLFFRILGAVRLRETIASLKRNLEITQQQKEQKRGFDYAVLVMRKARTFDQWWQAACTAARKMDLACISLVLSNRDGTQRTLAWCDQGQSPDVDNSIEMTLPVGQRRSGQSLRLQLVVPVNHSLETAAHRVALFARLLEECSLDDLPRDPRDTETATSLPTAAQPSGTEG